MFYLVSVKVSVVIQTEEQIRDFADNMEIFRLAYHKALLCFMMFPHLGKHVLNIQHSSIQQCIIILLTLTVALKQSQFICLRHFWSAVIHLHLLSILFTPILSCLFPLYLLSILFTPILSSLFPLHLLPFCLLPFCLVYSHFVYSHFVYSSYKHLIFLIQIVNYFPGK